MESKVASALNGRQRGDENGLVTESHQWHSDTMRLHQKSTKDKRMFPFFIFLSTCF